jgi:hypothetical protein
MHTMHFAYTYTFAGNEHGHGSVNLATIKITIKATNINMLMDMHSAKGQAVI